MREKILDSAIKMYNEKGVKFTIDDIAADLSISKKSVYKYFSGKDEIIDSVIEMVFDDIERQHYEILSRDDINVLEKLKKILNVNPTMMQVSDNKIAKLKELYPDSYKKIKNHFEGKWDLTLSVLDECRKQDYVKQVPDDIFRTVLIGIFDNSTNSDDYSDTVEKCIDWLFEGIATDKK